MNNDWRKIMQHVIDAETGDCRCTVNLPTPPVSGGRRHDLVVAARVMVKVSSHQPRRPLHSKQLDHPPLLCAA